MTYYLASPYEGYEGTREEAYQLALNNVGFLARNGISVFSPIVYGYHLHNHLPEWTHEQWMIFDLPFMRICSGIIVLMIPGWLQSDGVSEEILEFSSEGKPQIYMESMELPLQFLNRPRKPVIRLVAQSREA